MLKKIVDIIKNKVLATGVVEEFNEGDIYEFLNSGNHKYPSVCLTVQNIASNGDYQTLNGELFYVDRLLTDSSNRLDIQSYGMDVLKGVLESIVDSDYSLGYGITQYIPFTEKFADMCAGAYISFTFDFPADFVCDVIDTAPKTNNQQ